MVAFVVGYEGAIEWDASQPDGTYRKVLDVSRMTALGWAPAIKLSDGIADTYAWYESTGR
jgi:GDP-L-fucose synthase